MYTYGIKSQSKLRTVHDPLAAVAYRALELSPYDISIIHGWRGEEVQNELFDTNKSHKRWPDSNHNNVDRQGVPDSLAIDFAPWVNGSIPWGEIQIFAVIAGCFFAAADEHGVTLRWGGDWDSDGLTSDQTLMDWGHVEIVL